MRPVQIHSDIIRLLLKRQKIATLEQLKVALGTAAPATVFRKLGELAYRTSYSHNGRYYALDELIRFDSEGLWSFDSVWFSRDGTLLATLERFVSEAEAGYFATELKQQLHVDVNPSLLKLYKQGAVAREKVFGIYLYCAAEPAMRQRQMANRQASSAGQGTRGIVMGTDWVSDEIKAAIVLFVTLLDEKQRRLFAGLESMQFGHGGDRWIAQLLGLNPHTVAKGRRQLLERDIQLQGVRALGAGRPGVKKTPPK